MAKKINFKSKSLWKKIGLGVLAGVVLIGAVFGVTALFRKSEETTKEINPSWAIGGLNDDGTYLETKESIYTKDAFACKGLNIKMDFDNNISYRIFFYGYNDEFVSSTEKLTTNYSEDIDMFVKSARIVITPNEDSKISWYEKNGYAKQLTISVDKEQKELKMSGDLWITSSTMTATNFYPLNVGASLSDIKTAGAEQFSSTDLINVSEYDSVLFVGNIDYPVNVHLWSATKLLISYEQISETFDYNGQKAMLINLSNECCYASFSLHKVGSTAQVFGIRF